MKGLHILLELYEYQHSML